MLIKQRVDEFLETLASEAPAPGGGSISALGGAMAAGLVAMVCRLSLGRKGLEEHADLLQEVLFEASGLQMRLSELVDADTEAFNLVMKAFKMPKSDEREKAARSEAIQEAFRNAVEVPLNTARCCARVLVLAQGILGKFNPNTASDLGVSAQFAFAGLEGALMNVAINLPSIKDPDYVAGARAGQAEAASQAQKARAALAEDLEKYLV